MLLLALALAAGPAPADTVGRPASTPAAASAGVVTVHRQPTLPVVAIRLSLLADDPPGYAGAGHLFQHLHLPRLREQAERVGGEVLAARTMDAVVYTVVGPAVEMEYLAEVLRSALHAPEAGEAGFLRATRELAEERSAEWETAGRHVRAALRARIFPDEVSPAGTPAAAGRLTREALGDVWAEMYRPERVSVVAVGDVELSAVQRAFATLPSPRWGGLGETAPDTVPAEPPVAPEATRGWVGMAHPAGEASPAVVTVAARLLRDLLRDRLPAAGVETEHWWGRRGQALAVVATLPGPALPTARRAVSTSLSALEEGLDPAAVRDAAAAVRREMLFYARTPERMAEVVGSFADREGSGEAAQRFYAALEAVTEEEVRALLREMAERTPAFVEVPPQRLPERTR